MKIKDVELGKTYLTKIGETRARVIAVRFVDTPGRPRRIAVRRENETAVLPKARAAAALHPAPAAAKGVS